MLRASTVDDQPPSRPPEAPQLAPFTVTPVGIVRSPFAARVQAPRQPRAGEDVRGRVELFAGHHYEDALCDLESWDYIWLVTLFDRNRHWRPKVRPPRSDDKRGVFATRAPHRPNPIGISAVRLLSVEGLTLHIAELDLLDGTPVLDIKPYVAWADSIADAGGGWLATSKNKALRPEDPGPVFMVRYAPLAQQQLDYLRDQHATELAPLIDRVLSTGPRPHAYRRIRELGDGRSQLGIQEWRAIFAVRGMDVRVERIESGLRLNDPRTDVPAAHRAFAAAFSDPAP